MDVDKLGESDQEKIHVTVTEGGKDISNYVEVSVNTQDMTNANYQYVCEKKGTEWLIWPKKNDNPVLQPDELVISVKTKNQQEESWTKKVKINYYAVPKSLSFEII